MPRNIEIKARVDDFEALVARTAEVADSGPTWLRQDDTFFVCASGRLKLREAGDGDSELIWYRRADDTGPKESLYIRTPVPSPDTMREALGASFGVLGRVRKTRILFLIGQTRVHLDDVEGLGHFMELEVVLGDDDPAEEGAKEAERIMSLLGAGGFERVSGSYLDLSTPLNVHVDRVCDQVHRLAAFTDRPDGGNPAGVWVGQSFPDDAVMQAAASRTGYSETVFLIPTPTPTPTTTPTSGVVPKPVPDDWDVRYFSPQAEVPFCGHATIAAGVHMGEQYGAGRYRFHTPSGLVTVDVKQADDLWSATLTSVPPRHVKRPDELADVLEALAWNQEELDPTIPPARAWAGAWHLVVAVRERDRLENLAYDMPGMARIMQQAGLTTLQLIWRESPDIIHARNPFPVGGVFEDPATGAAAAALGGYLRDIGLLDAPAYFLIRQGEAMGRPSRIHVHVPVAGGIQITGTAVHIIP